MVSYTTAINVQHELQAASEFASTTLPSLTTITGWIEEESALIDSQTNSAFSQLTTTITLDYNGEEVIPLKGSPIISVNSFLYNTNSIGSSEGEAWISKTEDVDFSVYKDRGEIYLITSNFSPNIGRKRLKIAYTYGYSSTPLQIQLLATKKVALRVLNTLINKNVNERNDGGSVSVGSISIVEPESYGINSYKQLIADIKDLESQISKTDGIYRYNPYTI